MKAIYATTCSIPGRRPPAPMKAIQTTICSVILCLLMTSCQSLQPFACEPDMLQGMSKAQVIQFYFFCQPPKPGQNLNFAVVEKNGSCSNYYFATPREALRSIKLINSEKWMVFQTPCWKGFKWLEVTFQKGAVVSVEETSLTDF